jgi:MFS family permease
MTVTHPPARSTAVVLALLPYALVVFLGYLAIGIPLAALPLRVSALGFDTVAVGLVVGLQPAIALLTRHLAGRTCDQRGAKRATVIGAAACAAAGVIYLTGESLGAEPFARVAWFAVGRVALGAGDSLLLTGALAFAIGAVGAQNAGKVMVWIGIAIYGAIALGAPLGLYLQAHAGFAATAAAAALPPLAALVLAAARPPIAPPAGPRAPFYRVIGLVWRHGAGLALATFGFGAISAFVALDYQDKGWTGAGAAITAFGAAYVATRLALGHLPDRHGLPVARISLAVEALGLALLWCAPVPTVALAGAALSGSGFSLVFPALGVEAVRRLPPQSRGAGMGAYVAFFDLGLGLAGPVAGAIAAAAGTSAVFAAAAVAALAATMTGARYHKPVIEG